MATKTFTKKFPNIPTRTDYTGTFEESYWDNFTKKEINLKPESWICADSLTKLAREVGYEDEENLQWVRQTLTNGANLGCEGNARLGTKGRNSKTVNEYGDRLADSLQQWLVDNLACGPLTKEEVETHWETEEITVNPMSVRLKPNGKARIIVDMSHPHLDTDKNPHIPASVNSGIRKERFPATMADTRDVLNLLYWVGSKASICKADWNNAYKHIFVRKEDLHLQFLQLGGRFFMERALVFGCTSSPGLYDRIAKLVITLAILVAKVGKEFALQCLDDVVFIGSLPDCTAFYKAYREVCSRIGVSLASEEDPDKAFAPCTAGTILGIEYNVAAWLWKIPDTKVSYMMATLFDIVEGKSIQMDQCQSLAGRLNAYHKLVPGGKWERGWIQRLVDSTAPKQMKVTPRAPAISQARWWIINMANAAGWTEIPDTRPQTPATGLEVFPDAAGGSDTNMKLGLGGCIRVGSKVHWVYLPWPYMIRTNRKNKEDDSFARKLSMLEAVAGLATVSAHPDIVRNQNVTINTDNIGFADSYKRGASSCPYTYTVCKALYHVSIALNMGILVRWTPRVSGPGEIVADHLSKGKFQQAFEVTFEDGNRTNFARAPSHIPRTLIAWIENPVKTRLLGQAIIDEMASYTKVLRLGIEKQKDVECLVVKGKRNLHLQ